jgi:hypothetical protein
MAERDLSDYIEVAERIEHFRALWPQGTLRGDWRMVQVGDQHLIAYRAEAYRTADDTAPGVGCAWELVPGRTPFTRGSELQNAETSAWGRAIIAVGASDAKRGIASREEVAWRRAERDDGLPVNKDGSLSRSRITDAEKEAAGVMTDAQSREHGRLGPKRGESKPAARSGGTPDDDPWYGNAPPPELVDADSPGTISRGQQGAMHAKFTALGIKDRDERMRVTLALLGLDALGSSSDLSHSQAGRLLVQLEAAGRGDTVAAVVVEAARRRVTA